MRFVLLPRTLTARKLRYRKAKGLAQGWSILLDTKHPGVMGQEVIRITASLTHIIYNLYKAALQSATTEAYTGRLKAREGLIDLDIPRKCTGKKASSKTRRHGWKSWGINWVKNLGKQQRMDTAHRVNKSQNREVMQLDFPVSWRWSWAELTSTNTGVAHICRALAFQHIISCSSQGDYPHFLGEETEAQRVKPLLVTIHNLSEAPGLDLIPNPVLLRQKVKQQSSSGVMNLNEARQVPQKALGLLVTWTLFF